VAKNDVTRDEMLLDRLLDLRGHQGDEVINEVVAGTPDTDSGGQAAKVTDLKDAISPASDTAVVGDMTQPPDADTRGKVAVVIYDRSFTYLKEVGMAYANVRRDYRLHPYRSDAELDLLTAAESVKLYPVSGLVFGRTAAHQGGKVRRFERFRLLRSFGDMR